MTRSPALLVAIRSNGVLVGTLTGPEFLKASGAPRSVFLADAIKEFNRYKKEIGEPERAEVLLSGRRR